MRMGAGKKDLYKHINNNEVTMKRYLLNKTGTLDMILLKVGNYFCTVRSPKYHIYFLNLRHSLLLNYLFTTKYINPCGGKRSADLFSVFSQKPCW